MTACVKNHSRRVALAVSASLVGALSLGAATVPAFAETATQATDDTADPASVFSGCEFTWNVEPDEDGDLVVEAGTPLALKNIEHVMTGHQIPLGDVQVFYYNADETTYGTNGIDAPTGAGEYKVVVLYGTSYLTAPTFSAIPSNVDKYVMDFTVKGASLEGAYAFQGSDIADNKFMYTGYKFNDGDVFSDGTDEGANIHFADEAGNVLTKEDVYVTIEDASGAKVNDGDLTEAGDYTVYIQAKSKAEGGSGMYEGRTSFDFTIDKIDLENASISVDPVLKVGTSNPATDPFPGDGFFNCEGVYINGELVKPDVISATVVSGKLLKGDDGSFSGISNPNGFIGQFPGDVVVNIKPSSTGTAGNNFDNVGTGKHAHVFIVNNLLPFYFYDEAEVQNGDTLRFEPGDAAFDPAKISAATEKGEDDFDDIEVTVTDSEGNVLPADYDYTKPGTYTVRIEVKIDQKTFEWGGSCTFTVEVIGKRYTVEPKVYATVDGKDVTWTGANSVEYDAKPVVPAIVAKAGSAVLTAGEDYTVSYADADGNAVEEMVEPGTYKVTVDFGDAYVVKNGREDKVKPVEFDLVITKAIIDSAKADQDLYVYTGDVIEPTFTAWTNDDLTGLSVAVDSSKVQTTYQKVKMGADGKPVYNTAMQLVPTSEGLVVRWVKTIETEGGELQNYDLTEPGWYVANVSVANDDPHFQGTTQSQPFEISSYAHFSDVAADAYYAQDVYKANSLGYMTGVKGTDLFMPDANISRGELAKVFSNMAGRPDQQLYTPTKFSDVDAFAWYAEPIAWASEAGIVTGYEGTDQFGPNDTANREQVAAMIYRYAKAQGKDMTVDDADAALAAYADGDQVSGWAKTYMAWCVENGVFGVNTDELKPQDAILRSAVASIAVRVQPEALPQA